MAFPAALSYLRSCHVNQHRDVSDHHLLDFQLLLPWIARVAPPRDDTPIRQARWSSHLHELYSDALQADALEAVCAAASAGNSMAAVGLLHGG